MANKKGKSKHNKTMLFLLLPVLAIIFLIGWSMYMIGEDSQNKRKKKVATPKKDYIHFIPNIHADEKEVIAAI